MLVMFYRAKIEVKFLQAGRGPRWNSSGLSARAFVAFEGP